MEQLTYLLDNYPFDSFRTFHVWTIFQIHSSVEPAGFCMEKAQRMCWVPVRDLHYHHHPWNKALGVSISKRKTRSHEHQFDNVWSLSELQKFCCQVDSIRVPFEDAGCWLYIMTMLFFPVCSWQCHFEPYFCDIHTNWWSSRFSTSLEPMADVFTFTFTLPRTKILTLKKNTFLQFQ